MCAMSKPPLILVCDDEMHIRVMISTKLRSSGYEVMEARNGNEGLALATKSPPRMVITDFQMPMMSGIEMATLLRNEGATRDVPLIMLTARGYVLTPEQIAATNIREVLPKPFGVRQLLLRVKAILEEGETRRACEGDSTQLAA